MTVKLLKSTKYKGKILSPGTHDVIQKSAKEWIKLGIAVEVSQEKQTAKVVKKESKETENDKSDEKLKTLQSEAESLDVDLKD